MTRPRHVVLVVGTGTEVGKTWVGAHLATALRDAGVSVAARKPAQSFDATDDQPTDAEVLGRATGEHPTVVCLPHRWYETPMAPFMAADALGRPPLLLDDLVRELVWPALPPADVGLVETAGGVRSPMTSDGADAIDLAARLRPDLVILVADAGLGTLNAVRLCLAALDVAEVVVFLNRYAGGNDLHRRNREWLLKHLDAPVLCAVDDLAALVVANAGAS